MYLLNSINCEVHLSLQVCVEGRLYLEFMFDDMMRIKTWHFSIRQHREVVPRSILAMHVSLSFDATLGTSITLTLKFLIFRVRVILI